MAVKIIGLEEHFATQEIMTGWQGLSLDLQDIAVRQSSGGEIKRRLFNLADERIALMDAAGIDMQVLSLGTPGVQNFKADQAVRLARITNDLIAEIISRRPDRFQGFATLPSQLPAIAAKELERAIKIGLHGAMLYGRVQDRNLDHPDFLPIFETAALIHAPLYIHPQSPYVSVRDAYYSGFDNQLNDLFASAGIGWHYETGIQALRLVMSGLFDRFPSLQIIMGHWGEVVLFFLERIELMSTSIKLERPIQAYFKLNVFVTPSGFYSQRYLNWACEVLGSKRILFSTDYPYALVQKVTAREFLELSDLRESDITNISFSNWEQLCAKIKR